MVWIRNPSWSTLAFQFIFLLIRMRVKQKHHLLLVQPMKSILHYFKHCCLVRVFTIFTTHYCLSMCWTDLLVQNFIILILLCYLRWNWSFNSIRNRYQFGHSRWRWSLDWDFWLFKDSEKWIICNWLLDRWW